MLDHLRIPSYIPRHAPRDVLYLVLVSMRIYRMLSGTCNPMVVTSACMSSHLQADLAVWAAAAVLARFLPCLRHRNEVPGRGLLQLARL